MVRLGSEAEKEERVGKAVRSSLEKDSWGTGCSMLLISINSPNTTASCTTDASIIVLDFTPAFPYTCIIRPVAFHYPPRKVAQAIANLNASLVARSFGSCLRIARTASGRAKREASDHGDGSEPGDMCGGVYSFEDQRIRQVGA